MVIKKETSHPFPLSGVHIKNNSLLPGNFSIALDVLLLFFKLKSSFQASFLIDSLSPLVELPISVSQFISKADWNKTISIKTFQGQVQPLSKGTVLGVGCRAQSKNWKTEAEKICKTFKNLKGMGKLSENFLWDTIPFCCQSHSHSNDHGDSHSHGHRFAFAPLSDKELAPS